MAMVFEANGLSGPEKLLLLAYANYTDAYGYCWPGIDRLIADTGTSKATVVRTRKALEKQNLLRHQRRTSREGRQSTNLYRINLDKLRALRRPRRQFDDDMLGLEFEDEERPEPEKGASDQPRFQNDTPPSQNDTPPSQNEPPGGFNLIPPPSQSDTPSVIDPSEDPSRPDAREATTLGDVVKTLRLAPPESGRTDERVSIEKEPEADEVIDRDTATALVQRVNFSRVGARESQVWQIRDAVARALAAGYNASQVQAYLQDKVRQAKTVKFVLGAFEPARLRDIATCTPSARSSVPPACGQCDATDADAISARVVETATGVARCPRCHPGALAGV